MPINPKLLASITAAVGKAGGYDLQELDLGAVVVPGWEGFPTRKFGYRKFNPDGSERRGRAVTLSPSHGQMARWAITAAQAAGVVAVEALARRVVLETAAASGFQFLVRGVHLEAMGGGVLSAYPFFDGVTVKMTPVPGGYPIAPLTDQQLEAACAADFADVTEAGKYARVLSTTRGEFTAASGVGAAAAAGTAFLARVREAYKVAWGADENSLVSAAVRARKTAWGF